MRKEKKQGERKSCLHTNGCHASTSNYRHMKYELQLIFLPGVTGLRVLRTRGIYLGSKLTSFIEWPEQCNLCSVTGTSLWLLILDTCPSQKFAGKGFLDKDVEQCNYRRKGLAEADRGCLATFCVPMEHNSIPLEEWVSSFWFYSKFLWLVNTQKDD